jgi:fructuronate reductase
MDLAAYADALLARFANPALRHRLAQIAMDGTQKIPQRWLDTARQRARRGEQSPAIAAAFDAWLWHLEDARFVDDPLAPALTAAMAEGGRRTVIDRCLRDSGGAAALWPGYSELADALAGGV